MIPRITLLLFSIPLAQMLLLAQPFTLTNIGTPAVPASVVDTGGGFNLTSSGADIGGTNDQAGFYYQVLSGDFDVKVRVDGLIGPDAFAKAGLVAREGLNGGSRFGGAITTPSVMGSLFEARLTTNGTATSSGAFPVNYPNTWLRLKRATNTLTGYGSYDGNVWSHLGTATPTNLATNLYVGVAIASHANTAATGSFREFGDASGGSVGSPAGNVEPLGPSSRKTGLVISEIMYKPASRSDGRVLDFVEIFNSNPFFEDISGYRLSGGIDYTFPSNTVVQGGAFLVIAKVPADIEAIYGISNVVGPYSNNLETASTVRLRNDSGHIYLEVQYENLPPWPVGADGTGHSLTLLRPSYGEGLPQAWGISDLVGGSPGKMDSVRGSPLRNVVINEFLANTDAPLLDYVELYNHSNEEVDISGCILSDEADTNKFVIPPDTRIPARGYVAFDQNELGFGLESGGEKIYFWNPDRSRVLDVINFEAQANGVSSGRYPNGAPTIYPLRTRSPGTANPGILIRDIVINEIMYKPISGDNDDEYVELYNKGTNTINLGGWRFVSGIDYTFPSNTFIAPNGYLVVAENLVSLLGKYPGVLNGDNTVGDFGGSLANRGERLALAMPDISYRTNGLNLVTTNTVYVVMDEVTYGNGGNWGAWHNEGGSSLELIDARSDHRLAFNWADSDETAKAPWTTIEYTGPIDPDGRDTPNLFEVLALGEGEYLLDNAELLRNGTNLLTAANSTFDAGIGGWQSRGTHIRSSHSPTGGVNGSGCLHIRASARGDSIANRNVCPLTTIPTVNTIVTLRAQVRWLRGWPELLLRLHGNYIEAIDGLALPSNLGTPGAPNSRARTNAPPAIYQVAHSPVVPAANEPVRVTVRVHDPDNIGGLLLKYRVDPATSYASVVMTDSGTAADLIGGDGVFSATIPGQSSNSMVAFYVEARDTLAAQSVFPLGAPQFEALVRFGDPVVSGAFGTYRQWFTTNAIATWINRPVLSNERIYGTFVYGNYRAVHTMSVKYSGSPYHQGFGHPVTAGCHYSVELPLDDMLLGTENFNKIHAPGNGPFDDNTAQREQTCYWFARKMGLPWNYRRFVNVFVNGFRKGGTTTMMEDTETPGNDVVESRWPDDSDGHLYKLQPWFEVADGSSQSLGFGNQSWCTLLKFSTNNVHKKFRYRWNYLVRAADATANDYDPVFKLIEAASSPPGHQLTYFSGLNELANIEQWMRTFAVCHAVGDWDHVGTQNSQNMYGYVPREGRWELMIWDMNIVLGNSGSWGPGDNLFTTTAGDTSMAAIYANLYARRSYLRSLKELATGPMAAANVNPMMQAKYDAMVASGVTPTSPAAGVSAWIASARTAILSTVAGQDSPTFVVTNSITTNNNLITITGTAPLELQDIRINGVAFPIFWTSARNFVLRIPVYAATTNLVLQGYDWRGNPITSISNVVAVNYTGPIASPEDFVSISEIMFHPQATNASYIEFYNSSTNFAFDVSGWRVNGVGFTFPSGTVIGSQQAIIIVKSRAAFGAAYPGGVPIAGEFDGNLDTDGETLTLIKPGATPEEDIIIDRVRYENQDPWVKSPPGSGIALQVIDPTEDNARVSNWSDGGGWKYFTATHTNLPTSTNIFRLYMESVGGIYLDDLTMVAGAVPEAGPNLIRNGDFEGPLLLDEGGPWVFSTPNLSNTVISTTTRYSGNSSLYLVHQTAGPGSYLIQSNLVLSTPGAYTISFWYLPVTNNARLITYVRSEFRPGPNVRAITASPAATNTTFASLPPYPPLWLNELQGHNVDGIRDGSGTAEPWIELYNAGSNALNLAGLFLADNYSSNLTQWAFPNDATIGAGEFKTIWADGDPEENSATEWHTNFRLPPSAGTVALTRLLGNAPQILDYLTYSNVGPNLSYGDYPDGQPFARTIFYTVTPGATNQARPGQVFINEWLAGNQTGLVDPADGDRDDWFELYNPNDFDIDLGGYYLSDTLTNKTHYRIPNRYTIPARGFLLVWADSESGQNSTNQIDLHASFALARGGEALALFGPDGSLIDAVSFGEQTNDVSEGRFPDGAPNRYFMSTLTPRTNNIVPGLNNTPPVLDPLSDVTMDEGRPLTFRATATDADQPSQQLTFSLAAGAPSGAQISGDGQFRWTPAESQGPGLYPMTIRVTDNGVPVESVSQTFNVTVREVNRRPFFSNTQGKYIRAGETLSFLTGFDSDVPANALAFSLDTGAPAGINLDATTGRLTWTPMEGDTGSYAIGVQAVDNGLPALSAEHIYRINVYAGTNTVIAVHLNREGTNVRLTWAAEDQAQYEVQFKSGFDGSWQVHPLPITVANGAASTTDPLVTGPRFYRVLKQSP